MTETPWVLTDLRPADTPEYMTGAWLSCLSWAISVPEIVEAFRSQTGNQWKPAKTPIERMIDQSAGVELAFIKSFVEWANVNVWGPMDLPREKL